MPTNTRLAALAATPHTRALAECFLFSWQLSSRVRGRIRAFDLMREDGRALAERFQVGQPLRCRVARVNKQKQIVELTTTASGSAATGLTREQLRVVWLTLFVFVF